MLSSSGLLQRQQVGEVLARLAGTGGRAGDYVSVTSLGRSTGSSTRAVPPAIPSESFGKVLTLLAEPANEQT